MKNNLSEVFISIVLIVLLALFLNPFSWFMPSMLVMTLLAVLLIAFFIFAAFVWREKAGDEREQTHQMLAGRVAFLVGSGVLVLGIIIQEYQHALDPWLVYTLGAMILAKVGTLLYGRKKL